MDDSKRKDRAEDRIGDMSGDAQRGGRPSENDADTGKPPRPADEAAHEGIPSRSFNL